MDEQLDSSLFGPVPAEVKAQFSDTPWAIQMFDNPRLQAFHSSIRGTYLPQGSGKGTGGTFCGVTLQTPDTISAWQLFYQASSTSPDSQPANIISIMKLGSGVNGHNDTCHGGFLSVLLDEVIGYAGQFERPKGKTTMTAYLNTQYKRPIWTPGIVLCRAWIDRKEGRKLFGRGTIEDGEGNVMATGEALFLVVERVVGKEKL